MPLIKLVTTALLLAGTLLAIYMGVSIILAIVTGEKLHGPPILTGVVLGVVYITCGQGINDRKFLSVTPPSLALVVVGVLCACVSIAYWGEEYQDFLISSTVYSWLCAAGLWSANREYSQTAD